MNSDNAGLQIELWKMNNWKINIGTLSIIPSLNYWVTLSRFFNCLLLNHLPFVRWENFLHGFIKIR